MTFTYKLILTSILHMFIQSAIDHRLIIITLCEYYKLHVQLIIYSNFGRYTFYDLLIVHISTYDNYSTLAPVVLSDEHTKKVVKEHNKPISKLQGVHW